MSASRHSRAAAIQLDGLSKRFRAYRSNKLRVLNWLSGGRLGGGRWVHALRALDLTVAPGESLAVIGANGAGKSTLLKLICGTLFPSEGSAHCSGRVGALLELGMGFHPEFTGRENIRLNGLLLGMSPRELRAGIEGIIEFSGLGEFIDEPIRTYSSGMILRLGYSVAVSMKPSILLIDEVLAVGDATFQQRCYDHLRRFLGDGGTLMFVSHEPQALVKICSRAILLEGGRQVCEGTPAHVLQEYSSRMAAGGGGIGGRTSMRFETRDAGVRGGQFRAMIESVEFGSKDGGTPQVFLTGSEVVCAIRGTVIYPVKDLTVGMLIRDHTGADVYGTNSSEMGMEIPSEPGECFEARFAFRLNLGPGAYTVSAALHAGDQHLAGSYDWADQIAGIQVVRDPSCRFSGSVWLPTELKVRARATADADSLAALWERVFVGAPTHIDGAGDSARFLLSGVQGQSRNGAATVGGELLVAMRLCGEAVIVELSGSESADRSVRACIGETQIGKHKLPPGRHLLRFDVPDAWRNRTVLLCVDLGPGSVQCHGIRCEGRGVNR